MPMGVVLEGVHDDRQPVRRPNTVSIPWQLLCLAPGAARSLRCRVGPAFIRSRQIFLARIRGLPIGIKRRIRGAMAYLHNSGEYSPKFERVGLHRPSLVSQSSVVSQFEL